MSKFIIRPDTDILAMLKDKGYTSYVVRRDKVLGESTMQKFRGEDKQLPSWAELAKLVDLLHVSPVDLIAFQTDSGAVYDLTGKRIPDPTAVAPDTPATVAVDSHKYDYLHE